MRKIDGLYVDFQLVREKEKKNKEGISARERIIEVVNFLAE